MKISNTQKTFGIAFILLLVVGGGLNTLINWEWETMSEISRLPVGSVVDVSTISANYNTRLMNLGYQLIDPAKFSAMKPKLAMVEKITYDTGESYIQMTFSDNYVVAQKYGVSSDKGDYRNNIAFHVGGVYGCTETTVGKPSSATSYQVCTEVQGVDVLIRRSKEVTSYTAPECTNGETRAETCADGSAVVSANCVGSEWVQTYKTCQNVITPPPAIACATDVKSCPDGSYVERVPPDCNFVSCPANGTIPPVEACGDGYCGLGETSLICAVDCQLLDGGDDSGIRNLYTLLIAVGLGALGLAIAFVLAKRRG